MKEKSDITPENIIVIKDEYYYCINNLIYKGEKSEIYRGRQKTNNIIDSNNSYSSALTICVKKEPPFLKYPELDIEFNILNYLQQFLQEDENGFIPCPFVPQIYNYYHNNDSPSFLIEKLYGNSLNAIFKMCKYKFSFMSSLILMEQMISIIESLHSKGIIHRNLNPNKFLFVKEKSFALSVNLICLLFSFSL